MRLRLRAGELPHSEVSNVGGRTTAGQTISFTFRRLSTRFPFIAFVPQWDFLEFMTAHAARFPSFTLLRNAEVLDLVERDGVVAGIRYGDAEGVHELTALLTVGADGRSSRTGGDSGCRGGGQRPVAPLSEGRVSDADLSEVQRRRERPVRLMQAFQTGIQNRFLKPTLDPANPPSIPWIVRLIARLPILRDVPPRLIAFGIGRPHVESPARNRA